MHFFCAGLWIYKQFTKFKKQRLWTFTEDAVFYVFFGSKLICTSVSASCKEGEKPTLMKTVFFSWLIDDVLLQLRCEKCGMCNDLKHT